MDLDIQSSSDGRRTNYTLTGPLEDVKAAIERICGRFHPLGYGTSFGEPTEVDPGVWRSAGYRYNSCD